MAVSGSLVCGGGIPSRLITLLTLRIFLNACFSERVAGTPGDPEFTNPLPSSLQVDSV